MINVYTRIQVLEKLRSPKIFAKKVWMGISASRRLQVRFTSIFSWNVYVMPVEVDVTILKKNDSPGDRCQ